MTTLKYTPSKYFFFLRNHILKKKLVLTPKLGSSRYDLNVVGNNTRIIRKLNHENNLNRNWNVLQVLQTYTQVKLIKEPTKSLSIFLKQPMLLKYSPIYFSLTKELVLLEWEKKRQFFFFFNELLQSIESSNKFLLNEMSIFFDKNTFYLKEKAQIVLFENYLHHIFYLKESKFTYGSNATLLNALFLKSMQNLLISSSVNVLINRLITNKDYDSTKLEIKTNVIDLFSFWHLDSKRWELCGLPVVTRNNLNIKEELNSELILKRSKFMSIIRRRTKIIPQISLRNYNVFINKTNFLLKPFIWKTNTKFTTNTVSDSIIKLSRLYNRDYNQSNKKAPFQLLYLISRIEDKILVYTKTNTKPLILQQLTRLRNLFLYLIQEKKSRVMNESLLTTKASIIRIKTKTWKLKLLAYLQNKLRKISIKNDYTFYNFVNLIYSKLAFGRKNIFVKPSSQKIASVSKAKNFIFGGAFNNQKMFSNNVRQNFSELKIKPWNNKGVNVKRNWVGSKLVLAEKHLTFNQKKTILSSWINRPVDLFFINALSLTKFAFKNERLDSPNNNPNTFLSVLDRDFINKYKYIGIYIKDLVRVAFISIFFKKPSFLAKFMAFQLAKLPRNRKETNFIRFLIKVIKTFAAERKEILGIRIRFKGRVNRWRRTKFILGNRGTLPLQTISERIEQGTAQAVNKKGAVGIRIWLRYKQSFSFVLRNHILTYLNYSKALKMRKINQTLLLK